MIGIYAFGYPFAYTVYHGEKAGTIGPIRTAGITVRNIYENTIGGNPIETLSTEQRQIDPHTFMLHLTNEARAEAGVPPVQMGTNPAAQMHAEAALAGCYSSHWDEWGLKPYQRYTLTGGQGTSGENVSGLDYCIKPEDNYIRIGPLNLDVKKTVQGWLESPGHQRNMLDPNHTALNTGIAHDTFNTVMVQLFDSDYVEYTTKPSITPTGTLEMSGTVYGANLNIGRTVPVQILYDPPPIPLTRGQLASTYALCQPVKIGYLVRPLTGGRFYTDPTIRQDFQTYECVDPYEIPSGLQPPQSPDEAHQAWENAKANSNSPRRIKIEVRRIIADRLDTEDGNFHVIADLSHLLKQHGPGIYTIILWGQPFHTDKPASLSVQSVFWDSDIPDGSPYKPLPSR